ncbi:MAG: sensor histidine kinase [Shimia sp.]
MFIDQDTFSAVSNLTRDGLCLAEMVTDNEGTARDYRFLRCNDRFEDYTGLRGAEGRTALELVPTLERKWIDLYAKVGLDRESLRFEEESEAMGRWFEVQATPIEPHGALAILFRDVSSRHKDRIAAERAQTQAESALEELNHRVKNSLAMIAAIISLEARGRDEAVRAALRGVQLRLHAVAQLYDRLGSVGGIDAVEARDYLEGIAEPLRAAASDDRNVTLRLDVAPVLLGSRHAIVVGLIVNELVTNALKHAYGDRREGCICIGLRSEGVGLELTVRDDGMGMAAPTDGTGIGTRIVDAFVQDLDGTRSTETGADGTCVTVRF